MANAVASCAVDGSSASAAQLPVSLMEEPLPAGWFQNVDVNTGVTYYFNPSSGVSQWERPVSAENSASEGLQAPQVSASLAAGTSSTAAEQSSAAAEGSSATAPDDAGGWFYRDCNGSMQGPFQVEQLQQWRSMLPMDLVMIYGESSSCADKNDSNMAVELAELLGDGELLSNWRAHCPQMEEGSAPPAPQWEEWLTAAPNSAHQVAAGGNPITAAVLAGLSNDDEDAQLARLAAQQGLSLQQLREFQLAADRTPPEPRPIDYSNVEFNASRDPRSGRLTVTASCDEQDTSSAALYSELRSWCDPRSLEEALQENARRRHEKLPPEVWKKLRARKQALKKERLKQYLLT